MLKLGVCGDFSRAVLECFLRSFQCSLHCLCSRAAIQAADFEAVKSELQRMKQILLELCTCPISMQLMRRPLLGPDGVTYEARCIVPWVRTHLASPTTRQSMQVENLSLNRAVVSLLDLLGVREAPRPKF